jgi:uncharacterized protein YjbI with pentapeptide repeats
MARKAQARNVPQLADEPLAECPMLEDDAAVADATISGDYGGSEFSLLALRGCRLAGVTLTGSRLVRGELVDCLIVDSDLSGAFLDDCRLRRVEFRGCRMSGLQAQGTAFVDVALVDCKVDGANFRMTSWERAELVDCQLVESDFYAARLPGSRVHGCDLSRAELTKCDLSGSRLQRSTLDGIRGGESLRGVTIGSAQMIPAAVAVFQAMKIVVSDDE